MEYVVHGIQTRDDAWQKTEDAEENQCSFLNQLNFGKNTTQQHPNDASLKMYHSDFSQHTKMRSQNINKIVFCIQALLFSFIYLLIYSFFGVQTFKGKFEGDSQYSVKWKQN